MKSTQRSAVNDTKHKMSGVLPGFHHLWRFAHHRWIKSMNHFVLGVLCISAICTAYKNDIKKQEVKSPKCSLKNPAKPLHGGLWILHHLLKNQWECTRAPAHRSWLTPQSPKFFCGLKPENTNPRNIKQGTIPLPRATRSKQYHEAVPHGDSVEDRYPIFSKLIFSRGVCVCVCLQTPGSGFQGLERGRMVSSHWSLCLFVKHEHGLLNKDVKNIASLLILWGAKGCGRRDGAGLLNAVFVQRAGS